MTSGERLVAALRGEPIDRLPIVEWAPWWHLTLENWRASGLPEQLKTNTDVARWFGLEPVERIGIRPRGRNCPAPAYNGGPLLASLDDAGYEALLPSLFPAQNIELDHAANLARQRDRDGDIIVWLVLEGFFWFPRTLLGIEQHMLAFYDAPELIERINRDLLAFNLRHLSDVLKICRPDFVTLAEDMSYNHGPMLSRELFERFITPYLRPLARRLNDEGVLLLIDSDGDVTKLLPWLADAGVHGVLPLERAAGVDVETLQANHGDFAMLGGYDKRVISRGETAVVAEFERLMPAIRRGRFVPSVDHQTPPEVSIEQYQTYVNHLRRVARSVA